MSWMTPDALRAGTDRAIRSVAAGMGGSARTAMAWLFAGKRPASPERRRKNRVERLKRASAAAVAWIGLGLAAPMLAAGIDDLPNTIQRVKPSIVGIGTYERARTPPAVFRGTGFVVGDGLHVVTNAHVLPEVLDQRKFEMLAVFIQDGKTGALRQAAQVAVDEDHDTALLRIGGAPLPALRLRASGDVREGEEYAFTGFPIGVVLGLHPVTHRGVISAISPIAIPAYNAGRLNPNMVRRLAGSYDVFQLDATAYPGNSGSPLYDMKSGEVVGILNKVFVQETKENLLERPSGISYALPIKYAAELLRRTSKDR